MTLIAKTAHLIIQRKRIRTITYSIQLHFLFKDTSILHKSARRRKCDDLCQALNKINAVRWTILNNLKINDAKTKCIHRWSHKCYLSIISGILSRSEMLMTLIMC